MEGCAWQGVGHGVGVSVIFLEAAICVAGNMLAHAERGYHRQGIPVEGKSSESLICMKYRILILIIIISLGQIFYRILQTHHACTQARAHTRTHANTRVHARARTRAHTQPSPPDRLSLIGVAQP